MADMCIINKLTKRVEFRRRDFVPRMGERVDCFNISPMPVVVEVINFPSDDTIELLVLNKSAYGNCDAIILTE